MRYKTKLFIPNPNRCNVCQKLGHRSKFCSSQPICPNCGRNHNNDGCPYEPSCVNCGGEHAASANICPAFLEAKEILHIQTTNRCTIKEARTQIKRHVTPTFQQQSYASVTKKVPETSQKAPISQTITGKESPRKRRRSPETTLTTTPPTPQKAKMRRFKPVTLENVRNTTPKPQPAYSPIPKSVYNFTWVNTREKKKNTPTPRTPPARNPTLMRTEQMEVDLPIPRARSKSVTNISLMDDLPLPPKLHWSSQPKRSSKKSVPSKAASVTGKEDPLENPQPIPSHITMKKHPPDPPNKDPRLNRSRPC